MPVEDEPLSLILRRATKGEPAAVRGAALDALALKVADILGLRSSGTRLSGEDTGGEEADFTFENSGLAYSRWQVQCRNADLALVDDVAREVGLLDYFHADVGVIVSTGGFDVEAREFAKTVRSRIRQPLVLIDSDALEAAARDPASLLDVVRSQAPASLTVLQ